MKAHQYWPDEERSKISLQTYKITFKDQQMMEGYVINHLILERDKQKRKIIQFFYTVKKNAHKNRIFHFWILIFEMLGMARLWSSRVHRDHSGNGRAERVVQTEGKHDIQKGVSFACALLCWARQDRNLHCNHHRHPRPSGWKVRQHSEDCFRDEDTETRIGADG